MTRRIRFSALLALAALAASLAPRIAQPQTHDLLIRVVWNDGSALRPAPGMVRHDGTETWRQTDNAGRLRLTIEACDQAVTIYARPFFMMQDVEAPCRTDVAEIILRTRPIYSGLQAGLPADPQTPAKLLADPQTPVRLAALASPDKWENLQSAYGAADYATVARGAADLSYSLRTDAPGLAQSLSVLSMDAGYRALGLDPASPDLPLIGFDPLQQAYVMTPTGAQVYARHADRVAADPARWSFRGLVALPRGDTSPEPEGRALIRLSDPSDLDRLDFDNTGRFELGASPLR